MRRPNKLECPRHETEAANREPSRRHELEGAMLRNPVPEVARERMLRCALEMAESLLDCELGAAAYETAAGDGSGAANYAVRESVPHLAETELRRGLE